MKNINYIITRMNAVAFAIALAVTACSMKPAIQHIDTGPVQTTEIHVPLPTETVGDTTLSLEFMVGDFNIVPGAEESLAYGTAIFNAEALKPTIEVNGNTATLRQGTRKFDAIPIFDDKVTNTWDLQLSEIPIALNIQAGAYTGRAEFGGLALRQLDITEIGSDFIGSFSKQTRGNVSFNIKTADLPSY